MILVGDAETFANRFPEQLADELALAQRLGVRPMRIGERGFERATDGSGGKVKCAVTMQGDLVVIPASARGVEVPHSSSQGDAQ